MYGLSNYFENKEIMRIYIFSKISPEIFIRPKVFLQLAK